MKTTSLANLKKAVKWQYNQVVKIEDLRDLIEDHARLRRLLREVQEALEPFVIEGFLTSKDDAVYARGVYEKIEKGEKL